MENLPSSQLTEIKDKNNLVGITFGKWKVLVKLEGGLYAVECSCGFQSSKKGYHLLNLSTTQCLRCRIKQRKHHRTDYKSSDDKE